MGLFVELPNTVEGLVRVTDRQMISMSFTRIPMSWPVQPPIRDTSLDKKSRLLWTVLTKLCVQLILNWRNNITIMTKFL